MPTTVTLHEDCYPVISFQEAGVFEFGVDQSIDDARAVELIGKGRVVYPTADYIQDEDGGSIRDQKHNRIQD